jgi:hypothetical protein
MAYLGAVFLLHQSTYAAFVSFTNLIFRSEILRTFYSFDVPGMQKYYKVFQFYMKRKIPSVLNKFEELGITPDMFLLEWVYTLFSRYFDIDNVSRIISSYLLSDDSFIFRFGLAILISIEKKVNKDNMDEVASVINNLMQNIEYSSVIKAYEGLKITEHDMNRIRAS